MLELEMFSLEGKVAVVSGGSGKYGKQIVLALAKAGAKVVIASRNKEKNHDYMNLLNKMGYDIVCETLDISNKESIEELSKNLIKKYGKVDVLINNSVARLPDDKYASGYEKFDESIRTNGSGNYWMCKIFGDLMSQNGGGSVVNIGSYMGMLGPDETLYRGVEFTALGVPDYFFHKAGLTNLTRFMAAYYGRKNVRYNILQLGGLFDNQNPIFVERYSDKTFLNRMANDTDIMGAIIYLASNASAYVTGIELCIDGGYSAK